MAYVAKRGTLNLGMRLEYLFAQQMFQIASMMGAKPNWQKLLRYHEPAEEAKPLTDMDIPVEAFAAMFGAKKKKD